MKKVLALLFASSIIVSPVFAWGEGGCPFSKKDKSDQEAKTEQVDNFDSDSQ